MTDTIGVVVVGVGIAGRVRIRDLIQQAALDEPFLNNVKLIGHVTRRTELEIEGSERLVLEEALLRPDVHAVLICTENSRHARLARQVIEAGKHVLVEFPLALSADTAKDLLKLAQEKGVICYEEDISLITETHNKAKELVKDKGLKAIHKTLKGRPNGWIENIAESGSPYVTGISMLHRVVELCGDVTPVTATLVHTDKSYTATATLSGAGGVQVTMGYERNPEVEHRQASFKYKLGDDTVVTDTSMRAMLPKSDTEKPGLFLQDLMNFVSMIRGEMDVANSNALTIKALEVADELYKLANASQDDAAAKSEL